MNKKPKLNSFSNVMSKHKTCIIYNKIAYDKDDRTKAMFIEFWPLSRVIGCYSQLPGTMGLRFVLGWVTVLICQFLLIVLRMRLNTRSPSAAFVATV